MQAVIRLRSFFGTRKPETLEWMPDLVATVAEGDYGGGRVADGLEPCREFGVEGFESGSGGLRPTRQDHLGSFYPLAGDAHAIGFDGFDAGAFVARTERRSTSCPKPWRKAWNAGLEAFEGSLRTPRATLPYLRSNSTNFGSTDSALRSAGSPP